MTQSILHIEDILIVLETAYRHGKEIDEPEGARYIIFSDTTARKLIKALENVRQNHQRQIDDLQDLMGTV